MTDRFVTIGTDCNGRFNAYESDGTRIPLNRTGYASQDRTVAALRRFYVVAPGATPRVTLGGWILSGMAHPDRAIAPRDEAFVGRMIDHDIACEEKARARSDAALAAIQAERREPVHVEVRTLAGDMVRRHGPFDRSSPAFSNAYHSEMCASLGHNRMRRHDDESCQRVHIVRVPVMVPQQAQQQQADAAAARIAHPLPAGTRIRTKGGDWDSFIDEETDEDVERHAAPGEVGTVTAAPEHHAGQGWTYSVEFSPSGVWVFLDQAEVDDPAQYEVLPAMVPMPVQQQQARDARTIGDIADRNGGLPVSAGAWGKDSPAEIKAALAVGWRFDQASADAGDWPWFRVLAEAQNTAWYDGDAYDSRAICHQPTGEMRLYVESAFEALMECDC